MKDIYALNYLANTLPNDTNSFDTIVTNDNGAIGKYRTTKTIKDGYIVSNLQAIPLGFNLENGETIEEAFNRRGTFAQYGFTLTKVPNSPGIYFKRMFRPFLSENNILLIIDNEPVSDPAILNEFLKTDNNDLPHYFPIDRKLLLLSINQLSALKEMLFSIFNTVYPIDDSQNPQLSTINTYGQSIKNVLVLACIEVETQLKGIYKANTAVLPTSFTTNHYVKLKDILHLDKYKVRLPYYPDLQIIEPFINWTSDAPGPTKSLFWYDNYNAVKHNSEVDFNKANLKSAIEAVCAVAILLYAQYGKNIPYWKENVGSFFEVTSEINWSLDEKLLPPTENSEWEAGKINF
jgi:hypothetical protein